MVLFEELKIDPDHKKTKTGQYATGEEELQKLKVIYPNAVMSGSGSTYFIIGENFEPIEDYKIFNNFYSKI